MTSTGPAIRLMIVDDHSLVAETIAAMFEGHDDFELVGIARTVVAAADIAAATPPDVAIIDYHLADGDGVQLAHRLTEMIPGIRMLMLTGSADDQAFADAVDAGFVGFVTKDMAVGDLVEAVRRVNAGEVHMPPALLTRLYPRMKTGYQGLGSDITHREKEILGLLARGFNTKQIAEELFLSIHTVRNHAQNLMMKLQAHTRLEAVSIAIRERIIDPP